MTLKVSDSFRQLLLDFAVCFYKNMPDDILSFGVAYFKLIEAGKQQDQEPSSEMKQKDNKFPSFSMSNDSESDDDTAPPPVLAPRKSVFMKSYNPDAEDVEEVLTAKYPKLEETRQRLEEIIRNCLLFKDLEQEQVNIIIDAMKELKVTSGEIIIHQGDDGDYFYVIDSGKYEAYVNSDEGNDQIIMTYASSGYFGELALMYNQPRAASIRATSDGTLYSLDRNIFQRTVVKSSHNRRKLHEELLGKVNLLQALTDEDRSNIADVLQTINFPNGSQIIKEGDEANGMYFVISGLVRVTRIEGSDENVVKVIQPGEYFGELALLNKDRRAANCYASADTKLAFLSADAFERMMGPCLEIMQRQATMYTRTSSPPLSE